jgi:hypothetical protein
MKLCDLIPSFYIHVSVSDLDIPTIGLQSQYSKIGGLFVGIYKSFTDKGKLKLGTRPHSFLSENICFTFSVQHGISYTKLLGYLTRVSWIFHLPISCITEWEWQVLFSFFPDTWSNILSTRGCIANVLSRKFETNIPRNETVQPHSQLLHSCFCEQFIYSHDLTETLYIKIGGPIVGIYKWLIDTGM